MKRKMPRMEMVAVGRGANGREGHRRAVAGLVIGRNQVGLRLVGRTRDYCRLLDIIVDYCGQQLAVISRLSGNTRVCCKGSVGRGRGRREWRQRRGGSVVARGQSSPVIGSGNQRITAGASSQGPGRVCRGKRKGQKCCGPVPSAISGKLGQGSVLLPQDSSDRGSICLFTPDLFRFYFANLICKIKNK